MPKGKTDSTGLVTLTYNPSNGDKLLSPADCPGGSLSYVPCDGCGNGAWVARHAVAYICAECERRKGEEIESGRFPVLIFSVGEDPRYISLRVNGGPQQPYTLADLLAMQEDLNDAITRGRMAGCSQSERNDDPLQAMDTPNGDVVDPKFPRLDLTLTDDGLEY